MGNEIIKIADKKWQEMVTALHNKGADVAFDVFVEALKEAYTLNH